MTYHILNGDCLYDSLNNSLKDSDLQGEFIICRECFIDGPVSAEVSSEFRNDRAEYISSSYNSTPSDYKIKVIEELDKLNNISHSDKDEVYLWFEDDLFCQVNMWFILSQLSAKNIKNIYRIFPPESDLNKWAGFANLTAEELTGLMKSKVKFTDDDIQTGKKLWESYCSNNYEMLKELASSNSHCFHYLNEVVQAHIDRASLRPQITLKKIIDSGEKDFNKIFSEFKKTESIYGFGDLQVKLMMKSL